MVVTTAMGGWIAVEARASNETSLQVSMVPVRVCIDAAGVVSRQLSGSSCVGTSLVWSQRNPAPRLCWDSSRLDPDARTRTVSVQRASGCERVQKSISTGMRLLCADGKSGVLRWPVTRTCAPRNIPTHVVIGGGIFGQIPSKATTTTTAISDETSTTDKSTTVGTSFVTTTTTTIVPSGGISSLAVGGTGYERGYGIVVDSSGSVYTTGYFESTVDFDSGSGVYNLTSAGSLDVFITKHDSSGSLLWARQYGGTGNDEGFSIAIDTSGNVYTTGIFNGSADFDPSSSAFNMTSLGNSDVFVAKLNSSGDFLWAKRLGGSSVDYGYGIAVDGSGNVLTTGYFFGTNVDFDPGVNLSNLTSAGGADVFVLKLDSAGEFVWAKRLGGLNTDVGHGISVDGSGNVLTTGSFSTTADFDPGVGTLQLDADVGTDVFVSKLNSSGNFVWARQFGNTLNATGRAITVDTSGNVYSTGNFEGTVDFDPGANVSNLVSAGSADVFVSKLNSSGEFVWGKKVGGASGDYSLGIAVDGSGNVYTTGNFSGTSDFDPSVSSSSNLVSVGSADIFVSKLNSSGEFVWVTRLGGSESDSSYEIALDSSGNVYTTGEFRGTADFDPSASAKNVTSTGFSDFFVWKLTSAGALAS